MSQDELPPLVSRIAAVLLRALSSSARLEWMEENSWRAGPLEGVHLTVTGSGRPMAASGYGSDGDEYWWVAVNGLRFEGRPVAFAVTVQLDYGGYRHSVGPASSATQPLHDALTGAGL